MIFRPSLSLLTPADLFCHVTERRVALWMPRAPASQGSAGRCAEGRFPRPQCMRALPDKLKSQENMVGLLSISDHNACLAFSLAFSLPLRFWVPDLILPLPTSLLLLALLFQQEGWVDLSTPVVSEASFIECIGFERIESRETDCLFNSPGTQTKLVRPGLPLLPSSITHTFSVY